MLLVEIMTIIYCLGEKNAEYVDYRNSLQKEYIETYDIFINGIDERAQTLLSSLGNDNDVYYKRNVDKMVSDYERLSGVQIDQIYNWGVEKYADYTYGIFFCMVFAFVCMEYIYVSERKSGMLGIIRATKEGRSRIILSKWTVLVVLTVIFSLVQEIMVIVFDSFMYSTGNLKCSIQSLQIFRDCSYEISMFTAIIISILNHMFIAIIICSIVFVCFVSINSRIMECGIPIAIFLLEFFSLNDSPINIFYAWNMKNVIGVYQNLNIVGIPADKNYVNFIVGLAIIVFATLIGTITDTRIGKTDLYRLRHPFAPAYQPFSFILHFHAGLFQCFDMDVNRPSADGTPSRHVYFGFSGSCQQASQKKNRSPNASGFFL